jgi:CDGSH iron-sulfur domain-containing protein 3
MDLPKVTDTQPAVLELGEGVHAWCSCGLSQKGPFCDGSHSAL